MRNACHPAKNGDMRSVMAYRPVIGFFAHSMIHSVFMFSHSCRWGFAIVVVSVAGESVHGLFNLERICNLTAKDGRLYSWNKN